MYKIGDRPRWGNLVDPYVAGEELTPDRRPRQPQTNLRKCGNQSAHKSMPAVVESPVPNFLHSLHLFDSIVTGGKDPITSKAWLRARDRWLQKASQFFRTGLRPSVRRQGVKVPLTLVIASAGGGSNSQSFSTGVIFAGWSCFRCSTRLIPSGSMDSFNGARVSWFPAVYHSRIVSPTRFLVQRCCRLALS